MRIRGAFRPPVSRAGTIARRGLSGIECRPVQRVQRPGVCRALHGLPWYLPALVLARPALLPVVRSHSGCAWGWGLHLWGIWGEPGVGVVSRSNSETHKKAFSPCQPPLSCAKHPTPIAKSSKFPAKTKRPLQRVCVLCYTCFTSLEREESVK